MSASGWFGLGEIRGLGPMEEYLRLELCSRYVNFPNLSLRAAEADAGRRLLAVGEVIAEMLFSRSDSARSCLMISPFSHFSAFLGPPTHIFANMASSARAVTTPMKRRLTIQATFLACHESQRCDLSSAEHHFQAFSTIRVAIAPIRAHITPTTISGL